MCSWLWLELVDTLTALQALLPWLNHHAGLDLLASELTDQGVAELGRLAELQEVKLYQAGVTGQGLAALASTPAGASLHSLVLYGTGALQELTCLGEVIATCTGVPAALDAVCMQSGLECCRKSL